MAINCQSVSEPEEVRSDVQYLAAMGHRGSATSQEAKAADWAVSRLAEFGVSAEIQPFEGRTSWAVSYLLHVSLATVGAALLPILPSVTAGIAILVLLSLVGEHTTRWPCLRQLLGSSPSRNVFAKLPSEGEPTQRFVLVAHLDTQRTGLIWNEASQPLQFTATWLPIWLRLASFPVTFCLVLQATGGTYFALRGHSPLAPWLEGLLLLVYASSLALTANWWRSPYVPGALDNASGVAAVLSLAKRFVEQPIPGVEVSVLLTGCEESGLLGAAAWAKEHEDENGRLSFINMDCVGVRPIRYFTQETPVVGPVTRYPAESLLQAGRVASKLASAPKPIALPGPTDGLPFLVRGFRGLTIAGLTADGRMPNYHQLTDTAEKVDYDAIEEAVEFAWELMNEPLC